MGVAVKIYAVFVRFRDTVYSLRTVYPTRAAATKAGKEYGVYGEDWYVDWYTLEGNDVGSESVSDFNQRGAG